MANDNQHPETMWRRYAATFLSTAEDVGLPKDDIDACLTYAKRILLQGIPPIYDLNHFASIVGYDPAYLLGAIAATDKYYRKFVIPKKSGGEREIAEPLPSLKEIQRWILENILRNVPVHVAAKAYSTGLSIKHNARFHRSQSIVLTIDIKNFFPSIRSGRVYAAFRKIGFSKHVSAMFTDICCLSKTLPQGAPTSAHLSNIILEPLDARCFGLARSRGIRYTRYADDLTFSGDFNPGPFIEIVYSILKDFSFEPNLEKTRVLTRSNRQLVTGIVVNEKMQIPRPDRRKLRQEAYYIKKFGIDSHIVKTGIKQHNYVGHLIGKAGFTRFINPHDRDAIAMLEALLRHKLK